MTHLKNFLIKREQSQACLSFAKREKSRLLAKTILTLVALLAVTTGAWAQTETLLTTIVNTDDNASFTSGSKTFDNIATVTFSNEVENDDDEDGWYNSDWINITLSVTPATGYTITKVKFYCESGSAFDETSPFEATLYANQMYVNGSSYGSAGVNKIEVYGYAAAAASSGPEVAWDKAKKTGSFTMPGGNVTLEPEYYPQAALAAAPTAIPNVPATTDGAIVNAGTVKNIGETTTAQGTVMYYVSQSPLDDAALLALAADAWTADVPTAKSLTAGQAYVYYYVRGNDGDTDETTFSDGDILAANALTVTIAAEPTYAVTLSDEDNDLSVLDNYKGQEIYVNYTRSFTSGKTSTVCLPFTYTKKAGDGSFYAFTNIEKVGNEYVATMTEPISSTLTANTPYLYMPNATGVVDFGGAYTIPATLTAGETTSNGWTFKGTYEAITWTEAPTGIYGFSGQAVDGISQGQFVKVGAYVRIVPMRCYLKYKGGNEDYAGARSENGTNDEVLPETIKVRLISANGTVTAIGSLSTKTGEVTLDNDAWYSLDGRRVVTPTKGVYIKNGKKVVIK